MRKDSDNIAIIERLRPKHAELLKELIRCEADLARSVRDVEEHRKALREGWGTDDLDAVRKIIVANYEANTREIDDFEALMRSVQEELAELDLQDGRA